MSWSDKPDLSPGTDPDGSQMEILLDQVESLTAPGWTNYSSTFTLTGSVSNPTLGNSTVAAYYRQSTSSDLVHVRIYLLIGSTFVVGSGDYRFSLPVPASAAEITGGIGVVYHLDASPGTNHVGICVPISASQLCLIDDGVSNFVGAANPVVPATGDTYRIKYAYEPA